jgi:hypothetical protein
VPLNPQYPVSVGDLVGLINDEIDARLAQHVTIEDLPTVSRVDSVGISATTFRPVYAALGPCRVLDVGIVALNGMVVGTMTDYWRISLCNSHELDGNPTTVAGGLDVIATHNLDGTGFSQYGLEVNKVFPFSNVSWDESANAHLMQPKDILGILWEKVGSPAGVSMPLMYLTRVGPTPIA